MALKHVQKTYQKLGQDDPLYAVLSFEHAEGNRWDEAEFFDRGRREISAVFDYLADIGVNPGKGSAMDFGCGVGRLTQALCDYFETAVGVDISESMIEAADHYNKHGERCSYAVNTSADLALFNDAQFDFIYSNISLQHSPPEATSNYIAEFMRILKPGGIAHFQIPSGPRHDPGSPGAWWYSLKRGPWRRFWKRIRGKAPVEMHYLNSDLVEEIIQSAGGEMLNIMQEGSVRRSRVSLFYTAMRTG